jgi:hypothetical protein
VRENRISYEFSQQKKGTTIGCVCNAGTLILLRKWLIYPFFCFPKTEILQVKNICLCIISFIPLLIVGLSQSSISIFIAAVFLIVMLISIYCEGSHFFSKSNQESHAKLTIDVNNRYQPVILHVILDWISRHI